jgi:hypothetical protein
VHRAAAKAFDIYPSRHLALAHFRHCFGEVATAALIAIPDRFFATIEDVRNR